MQSPFRWLRRPFTSIQKAARNPWFVDVGPIERPLPPHMPMAPAAVPNDAPDILKLLYSKLLESPHLEKSQLTLGPTILPAPGPPLPLQAPHGRRKRGGTYAGESAFDDVGRIWDWAVTAQVRSPLLLWL